MHIKIKEELIKISVKAIVKIFNINPKTLRKSAKIPESSTNTLLKND